MDKNMDKNMNDTDWVVTKFGFKEGDMVALNEDYVAETSETGDMNIKAHMAGKIVWLPKTWGDEESCVVNFMGIIATIPFEKLHHATDGEIVFTYRWLVGNERGFGFDKEERQSTISYLPGLSQICITSINLFGEGEGDTGGKVFGCDSEKLKDLDFCYWYGVGDMVVINGLDTTTAQFGFMCDESEEGSCPVHIMSLNKEKGFVEEILFSSHYANRMVWVRVRIEEGSWNYRYWVPFNVLQLCQLNEKKRKDIVFENYDVEVDKKGKLDGFVDGDVVYIETEKKWTVGVVRENDEEFCEGDKKIVVAPQFGGKDGVMTIKENCIVEIAKKFSIGDTMRIKNGVEVDRVNKSNFFSYVHFVSDSTTGEYDGIVKAVNIKRNKNKDGMSLFVSLESEDYGYLVPWYNLEKI